MTTEEIIESIAKEIRDRGGFQNYWDFELALKRILTAKFDEAHKAAIEEEREAYAKMLDEKAAKVLEPFKSIYKELAREIRARSNS